MRKWIILLLLPMLLISSTSRWELNYRYHGTEGDSTPVEKSTLFNYAIVYDSTLWVASANDSMIGDSFSIFPYDPYSYTALQGHDSVSIYYRQADKPEDFSKITAWNLLTTIGEVSSVPESEFATGNVFYAKPWIQFMWVTGEAKDSVAIEFRFGMIGLINPGAVR